MPEICVLSIYVDDLDTAKAFYTNVLGFEIEQEHGDCIVRLKTSGLTVLLEQIVDNYPERPCIIPGIGVDNLQDEISLLQDSGVELIFNEPQEFPAGKFVAFRDIAGNVIEMLEFRE